MLREAEPYLIQTNHLCAYLHVNLLKDPSSILAVF